MCSLSLTVPVDNHQNIYNKIILWYHAELESKVRVKEINRLMLIWWFDNFKVEYGMAQFLCIEFENYTFGEQRILL